MILPPDQLAKIRGSELLPQMEAFYQDLDWRDRGAEMVQVEKCFKDPDLQRLNGAAVFHATHRLFREMSAIGDTAVTRQLLTAFRAGLTEAAQYTASLRTRDGQPAQAADGLLEPGGDDQGHGHRRAFGR